MRLFFLFKNRQTISNKIDSKQEETGEEEMEHIKINGHTLTKHTTKKLIEELNELYDCYFDSKQMDKLADEMELCMVVQYDLDGSIINKKHTVTLPDGNEIQLEPTKNGGYFF